MTAPGVFQRSRITVGEEQGGISVCSVHGK